MQVPLNESAQVVLDGQGSGTAQAGPLSAYESWQPAVAAVSVATNTLEAECAIYIGDQPVASNFAGATLSGSTGDTNDLAPGRGLRAGEYVWAVWAGGDPGATATLAVTGTRTLAGP